MRISEAEVQKTQRGFEIIDFADLYGRSCSLQQSSAALNDIPGSGAIWLGVDPHRMHLDQDMVCALIARLSKWLAEGSFQPRRGDAR